MSLEFVKAEPARSTHLAETVNERFHLADTYLMNICTSCRHPWEPSTPDERCPDCGAAQIAAAPAPADPFAAAPSQGDVDDSSGFGEVSTGATPVPPPLPRSAGAAWDPPRPQPGAAGPSPSWTPPPAVGTTSSGMSTGAKIAIGVGIGFVVLIGVAFIAGVAFFRSVAGSEEFQTIIDEATAGGGVTVDYPLGTCFNHGDSAGPVPCSEAHSHEVFALTPWTGDTYPDYEEAWITVFCDEPFEDYVGIEYFESKLFYDIAVPSVEAWDSGDHDIRCIAYEPGSDLTESIRNAAY